MIFCATVLLAFAPASRAESALAPLAKLANNGARVGAVVMRLDDGKVLAALNPDTALVPASTSKLYVAAAALDLWGTEKRFITRFLATGPVVNGTLHGDLVFVGGGDPAFTNETLATLVRRLADAGIRRVSGDLVVNAGYFGKLDCVPKDRCEAKLSSQDSYDSGLSSAAINFSNIGVAVTPAPQAGSAARVRQIPYVLPSFRLDKKVQTTADGYPEISLTRRTLKDHTAIAVRGRIPVHAATHRYYVSVGDPNRYAGELVAAFLAAANIQVNGKLRISQGWPPRGEELTAVKGQPLWLVLRRTLLWSNNFMADMLALDWMRAQTTAPLSLTTAGAALANFGRKLEAHSSLMDGHEPQVMLASGSGLTPASRVSARDLAALLDAMYHRTDLFPGFLGALTVPQYTPVGMLKDGSDSAWMHRLAVKSGSFHGHFKVFSLAGYLRFPDGGWGAFAVIVNGTSKYQPTVVTDIAATRAALTPFLEESPRPARQH